MIQPPSVLKDVSASKMQQEALQKKEEDQAQAAEENA